MKKTIIYALFILAVSIVACDPIEERDSIGGAIAADQLDIAATPIKVNGKNGNMIILENHSPVMSAWVCGSATSNSAYDTVMVVSTGSVPVTFTGLNPNGTKITKTLSITVDTLSTLPEQYKYLFGDPTQGVTSKKYVWDETAGAVWGNGGYLGNTSPGWWTNDKASMNSNDPDYGSDGYMIFDLNGLKLTKSSADGSKTVTGKVALDLSYKKLDGNGAVWSSAKLKTTNVTVLCGRQPNNGNAPVYDYHILKLNDSKLVLAFPEGGDDAGAWSTAWFWMFRKAN
jgi:hypothetical protein